MPQLGGERLHRQHRLVLADRLGVGEQPLVLDPAEILALEQFGRQDHLRAPAPRASRTSRDTLAMFASMSVGEGELERGDGDLGHATISTADDRSEHAIVGGGELTAAGQRATCATMTRKPCA